MNLLHFTRVRNERIRKDLTSRLWRKRRKKRGQEGFVEKSNYRFYCSI
jgi:hypothetical protein